jgi:hypothetical protein
VGNILYVHRTPNDVFNVPTTDSSRTLRDSGVHQPVRSPLVCPENADTEMMKKVSLRGRNIAETAEQ